MIIDGLLLFTGTSNGATGGITSTTNTDAPTTGTQVASNILDLGIGSSANPGIPAPASGGGARDIGIGGTPVLWLWAAVAVAFASATSMALVLEGAPDNGSASPGSYTEMWRSFAIVEANLDVGAQLANVSVPRVLPAQVLPRYLRLSFVTVGTHTAGTVAAGIILNRFDQIQGADSVLSGYPAGVTVAN